MNVNTFVVGYGAIGRELIWKISQQGWNVKYIARSDGLYSLGGIGQLVPVKKWTMLESDFKALDLTGISVAFIATPPSSDGQVARRYAALFARRGIKIVVCDKSLIAHYPSYMSSVGFTSTVGGGSHLLPFLREHVRGRLDVHVQLILNATLNFVMTNEKNISEAVSEAINLGMTEPDATGCLGILNNEITDTVLKACIIANWCFAPHRMIEDVLALKPGDVEVVLLTADDLSRLQVEKNIRRYVVSFSRDEPNERDVIGGFHVCTCNGWHISAGFRMIGHDSKFGWTQIYGANNAAVVFDSMGGGEYIAHLTGIGAGPRPTVRAMIQDARKLLSIG